DEPVPAQNQFRGLAYPPCAGNGQAFWPKDPVSVALLTLSSNSVVGGQTVTGTITLSAPAPYGGAVVNLSDTLAAASVPASVTIPMHGMSATFTVSTTPVTADESGQVSVTGGGIITVPLTIRRVSLLDLTLSRYSTRAGVSVNGTVTLDGPAGPGAIVVALS